MLSQLFKYLLFYLYRFRSYLLEEKETLPFFEMEIERFFFAMAHSLDFNPKLADFN